MALVVVTFTKHLCWLTVSDEVIQTWPATRRYLESLGYVNSQLFGGSKGNFKREFYRPAFEQEGNNLVVVSLSCLSNSDGT